MRGAVIVNPAARKGGAMARWPAIQAALAKRLGLVEPMFTQAPGHATQLARVALAQGVRRFVADDAAGDLDLPPSSGNHVRHPRVRTARGASFRCSSDVETLVDLDGEMAGRLPLKVTVLPQAFRVGTV